MTRTHNRGDAVAAAAGGEPPAALITTYTPPDRGDKRSLVQIQYGPRHFSKTRLTLEALRGASHLPDFRSW
jgi:hypothetical protein